MWGFLHDAEVSLGSINRQLMLPMSRESWVLKEAAVLSAKSEAWERSAVHLATRESCSRPQSRQSSRPRTAASRPSSVGCRKPKRAVASLSELKESNRTATWLQNFAAYEQSAQALQALGDIRRSSLQRMSSAPEVRPSSATNRSRRAQGGGATPERQRTPNGRRLRRQCSGLRAAEERASRREELSGWPSPWADSEPVVPRPNTTPSRTRDKRSDPSKGSTTGLVRAVECDKQFQAQLLESWRRAEDLDEAANRVHRRQVCLFFDFLRTPEGEMNMESAALPYIEQGFADNEYLEAELARCAPDLNAHMPQAGGELPAPKKNAIRQVLVLYSQVAKPGPTGVLEVLYRSSFCRFVLDSNLVAIEPDDGERPTYHKSVRLFDNISKYGNGGTQRFANIDHCVTLVVQLMMQINMPAALAWELFEEGLQRAERTAEELLGEGQKRARDCAEVLAKEVTDEAILERRMDMFGKHGSPPQLFQGSLISWTRGLRFWVNTTTNHCMPENTMERIEQSLANEQFARDEIVEPGCLYIVAKFQGLFEELFTSYCYEHRMAVKEDENGKIRTEPVPHMSFAAFFRFCSDFGIFPSLVSFDEAWLAYKNADCLQLLGSQAAPIRVKQFKKAEASPSRVSAILGLRNMVNRVRKGKDEQEEDKKTDTSNSDQEENSSSASDESSGEDDTDEEAAAVSRQRSKGIARSSRSSSASKEKIPVDELQAYSVSVRSTPSVSHAAVPSFAHTLAVGHGRTRHAVNDNEVAAALVRHRRQSIGPGDDHLVIPIIHQPPEIEEAKKSEEKSEEVTAAVSARLSHRGVLRGSSRRGSEEAEAPEEQTEQHVKRGTKFLNMLGSLNPEKVKDLAMHSPGGSLDDAPVLPRVKTTTDFSWLSKPFREMTDKELKGYSLLIAVGECCRDHFLNVRGLVRVGKIGATKQGLLSYLAFMELLKKFRVTHGLETSSELQEFMRMVDPCSAGLLDPVELEKAISAVREDEARRRPKAPPKGGQFAATLGEQARRLSNLPNEVDVKGAEVPCAFGTAAFIESLLLLGYRHMNGSGQPIKCCAPAAAKAMYLINFLHHQHDRLAKEVVWRREQEKAAAAEQAATVLVRPRSPPPAPTPKALVIPRVSAMNKMVGAARKVLRAQREARSNQHRNAVVTAVDIPDTDAGTSPSGNSSPSQSSSRCALEPGPEPPLSSRGNVPPKEEKPVHWPDSAAYTTVAEAFLKNNQDLFKRWMDGEGRLPQLSPWFSESNQMCTKCKRKRDQHGIGNVFCHVCSCVDSRPLTDMLLYPVMERARLRRRQGWEAPASPSRLREGLKGGKGSLDGASQVSGGVSIGSANSAG